jgi:hypothetical protein
MVCDTKGIAESIRNSVTTFCAPAILPLVLHDTRNLRRWATVAYILRRTPYTALQTASPLSGD